MPQTSPINWLILSLASISSIIMIISHNNTTNHMMNNKKMDFYMTIWSWNW